MYACIPKSHRFPARFFKYLIFRVHWIFHSNFRGMLMQSLISSRFSTCENNSRYNHRGVKEDAIIRTLGKTIHVTVNLRKRPLCGSVA